MQITHFPFPPPGEPVPAEPTEAYPVPVLTSDMPCDRTASAPAAGLLALARSHGWIGHITHASGYLPHALHGTPGKEIKHSEAVRLVRDDQRAVAVRIGGSWGSLWTWSGTQFFKRYGLLAEFKASLAQPVDNPVDNPSSFL